MTWTRAQRVEIINDAVECLSANCDYEFAWRGNEHAIELGDEGLTLSRRTPDHCVLHTIPVPIVPPCRHEVVGDEIARRMLNAKVLDGKSLIERLDEITFN